MHTGSHSISVSVSHTSDETGESAEADALWEAVDNHEDEDALYGASSWFFTIINLTNPTF